MRETLVQNAHPIETYILTYPTFFFFFEVRKSYFNFLLNIRPQTLFYPILTELLEIALALEKLGR